VGNASIIYRCSEATIDDDENAPIERRISKPVVCRGGVDKRGRGVVNQICNFGTFEVCGIVVMKIITRNIKGPQNIA